ncbi:YceI family protein [Paenalcaligenes niemegkensis]|uniref:YceI family protein n=1 Tax=Paenalcaligenes niemegkensis TaxID=2895469 RepID=UPI001EE7F6B9|nr:YceI family protein [Paenalcaligenes niemegkensis]MCQ9616311.1 YceI family protein [Paenalcaligenes niemegkensis]
MLKNLVRISSATILTAALASAAVAAPVNYAIDESHTFPRFSYDHMGFSTQLSVFKKTTGTVVLDREAKTGEINIEIDTRSVDTGHDDFNGHIQGEDFLNTAEFPTATFKSTSVNFDGDTPASVDGELTIKGVSKPVTLEITHFVAKPHPMLKKEALGANATVTIKRSEFNAGKFAPAVGDDVTITIALEALAD